METKQISVMEFSNQARQDAYHDYSYESQIHSQQNLYNDQNSLKEFPLIPKRLVFLILFLLFMGFGFLLAGLIDFFQDENKARSISFIVIGSILFTPGFYYTWSLYNAYSAKTPEERLEILAEIPIEM